MSFQHVGSTLKGRSDSEKASCINAKLTLLKLVSGLINKSRSEYRCDVPLAREPNTQTAQSVGK